MSTGSAPSPATSGPPPGMSSSAKKLVCLGSMGAAIAAYWAAAPLVADGGWLLRTGLAVACLAVPVAALVRAYLPAQDRSFMGIGIRSQIKLKRWIQARMTVADIWEERVASTPDKEFVAFEGASYTYAQADAVATRIQQWAAEVADIKCGDTVMLMMENRPEFLFTWLGLVKRGATVALINFNITGKSLVHCLHEATGKVLIFGPEVWESVNATLVEGLTDETRAALPDLRLFSYSGGHVGPGVAAVPGDAPVASLDAQIADFSTTLDAAESQALREGLRPGANLFLIYTSGTTGLPKAAKFPHFRYMAASAIPTFAHVTDKDRVFTCLPLYHSAGGVLGSAAAIILGSTMVLRRKFSASRFWQDCYENNCTAIQYIGEICRYLVNRPPGEFDHKHKVTKAFGNGLRADVWAQLEPRFGVNQVCEFYASTEGNVATLNNLNRIGACGYLPPVSRIIMKYRIVKFDHVMEEPIRVNGRCVECDDNEVGEMIGELNLKDPLKRFSGYTNKAASDKKIMKDVFAKGDQWFRTGDLMRRDADGFVYFSDRIGDTFRWKGENVSTNEVGEAISGFADVEEANVYGVPIPNCEGNCGMAVLGVSKPADKLDMAGLYSHLCDTLPAYARPVFLRFPTGSGVELTATFKHRKVDYRKDGFDVTKVKDPIYFRDDRAKTFAPLTIEIIAEIESGNIRF